MADEFVLKESNQVPVKDYTFEEKYYTRIPDNNNGQYNSNQITWNLSNLTTDNVFLSCKESSLEIPFITQLTSGGDVASDATLVQSLVMKQSFCSLVEAFSLSINRNNIVNFSDMQNLPVEFKLLSTFSEDDLKIYGDRINFAKHTESNQSYQAATSASGLGESNMGTSNLALAEKMKKTSYQSNALFSDSSLLLSAKKSHVAVATAKQVVNYHVMAVIPLMFLHDVFAKLPMIKNPFLQLTCRIHSATTSMTNTAAKYVLPTVVSRFNYNPMMFTGVCAGVAQTMYVNSGIGSVKNAAGAITQNALDTACHFNACLYKFNPDSEMQYISNPSRKVSFLQTTPYVKLESIAPGGMINFQVINKLANIRGLLMITQIDSSTNGLATPATAQNPATSVSTLNSPYSASLNMIGTNWSQFNVKIGGVNHYKNNVDYGYDLYQQELVKSHSVNGGMFGGGLNSGLITETEYTNGPYGYVYVDLSKYSSETEDIIPKSVYVVGRNNTLARVNVTCYLYYEDTFNIDVSTSEITV